MLSPNRKKVLGYNLLSRSELGTENTVDKKGNTGPVVCNCCLVTFSVYLSHLSKRKRKTQNYNVKIRFIFTKIENQSMGKGSSGFLTVEYG